MTHDELLAKIKREEDYLKIYAEGYGFVVTDALRAIVELHKPTDPKKINYVSYIEVNKMCSQCRVFYPCPTIQAIEGQLK